MTEYEPTTWSSILRDRGMNLPPAGLDQDMWIWRSSRSAAQWAASVAPRYHSTLPSQPALPVDDDQVDAIVERAIADLDARLVEHHIATAARIDALVQYREGA
jgi:hypothetical protein